MTDFEGIVPPISEALTARGYDVLTPVQVAVSAPELKEEDLLVSAQTGSGKTVAFGIAIAPTLLQGAHAFDRASQPLALVVAPTRELALQVNRELEWLYGKTAVTMATCVGGMDMRTERRTLDRGAHIVVGTPGRLRDHIERGSLELSSARAVVLDEADEMLDLGFRDDLEYILDAAPKSRRTLLFSATVPRSIANLAKRFQRDAVRVETMAEREQHHDIDYQGLVVAPNDRENAIINVLRFYDAKNTLVFCGTRATVNHMTSRLNNRGFSVVALSGELSQNERTHALQAMRDGRARVCVATDVAARGIDLPNLDLVIHADVPRNSEALLHRSGRTGRAGRKGVSALIVPHNARRKAERLLSNANIEATWAKPPSLEDVTKRDRERILEDTALTEALNEEEQAFATELLSRHSADHIAAAYLRMHKALQPAPEELLDAAPMESAKPRREDFKNGVWFSLSVGRKEQAEARWLLPMLCRAGHITKNEIGAIRIHQTETHFELAPDGVEKFLAAIGPGLKVEKDIVITRLEGVPKPPAPSRGDHSDRGRRADRGGRPERGKRADHGDRAERGGKGGFDRKKKPYQGAKPDGESRSAPYPKRTFAKSGDKSKSDASGGKPAWEKKSQKPKRAVGVKTAERADKKDATGGSKNDWVKKDKTAKKNSPHKASEGFSNKKRDAGKPGPERREDRNSWAKDPSASNPKKKPFRAKRASKARPDKTGSSPLKRKKPSNRKPS